MRIKKQLLLVSLITLALPWVGCQYIREMDSALQKGQTSALEATANAIAARLGNDRKTVERFKHFQNTHSESPYYIHKLNSQPVTDGYADEWITSGHQFQTIEANLEVVSGEYSGRLYLYLRTKDDQLSYHRPYLSNFFETDHLTLNLLSSDKTLRTIVVYASGEGRIHASRRLAPQNYVIEHNAKGAWLEWQQGYQVELTLPAEWSKNGISILLNGETQLENIPSETTPIRHDIPPSLYTDPELSKELSIFGREGVRLSLSTQQEWLIANNGTLDNSALYTHPQQHGLLRWIYKVSLGEPKFPALPTYGKNGKVVSHNMDTDDWYEGLSINTKVGRFQQGNKQVVRLTVPIYNYLSSVPEVIGVVVADQSSDSLASMSHSAFNRLLFYSITATVSVSIILILYATWLSFRIRTLSSAAVNAITESGKIDDSFPVYSSDDEIGDLSRSYAHLLARLQEYTNYLRTLSSKLSHELRTPLAIVRSSLDNLEHEDLSTQAKVYAERAKEGTTRLSNILNAMSAASRVEQAIGAAELEDIPCDQLLKNLAGAYKDVYKNVTINLNIRSDNEKLIVRGSGELLVQMLDKLVDNAADFCPNNGKIELGLYRHNDTMIFTVHNEGPPLPSHMHGQLFDSMVSVRDNTAPDKAGHHLGLGLYIVRLIADFHRGEVHGYNVPDNSGVIFEIRIPVS